MKAGKRSVSLLTVALVAMGSVLMTVGQAGAQVTITYVGAQYDFEAKTNDAGVGWRNATTAKTYDIDGDNVFGTDGYQIFHTTPIAALPTYVTSVTRTAQGAYHLGGVMDDPAAPSGTDTLAYGMWFYDDYKANPGRPEKSLFSFVLTNTGGALAGLSAIRVTVFQDNYYSAFGAVGSNSQQFRLAGPSGVTASSGVINCGTPNGLDAIAFDITGFADGDVYTLYSTATGASVNTHAVGVVFDSVGGATATPGTLIYGK